MEDVIPEILIDLVPATTSNELPLENSSSTTETPTVNEPISESVVDATTTTQRKQPDWHRNNGIDWLVVVHINYKASIIGLSLFIVFDYMEYSLITFFLVAFVYCCCGYVFVCLLFKGKGV